MKKVLNPALLGNLAETYKTDMLPYINSESGRKKFEEDLKCLNLTAFEYYDNVDFGALFLDCLIDKDCIGDEIKSDDKYIYFEIDMDNARETTGVDDVEGYIFDYIYTSMFDENHRKDENELWYMDVDCQCEPEYYIRFDPVSYCNTGITRCFRFVIYMDNRYFDYLEDDTDLDWMKECHYSYIEFARSQYKNFAEYAVKATKRYIRENLLQDVMGEYKTSHLQGNTYFQRMRENSENKDYIVYNYLMRIERKEKVKWYEVYKNLIVALD